MYMQRFGKETLVKVEEAIDRIRRREWLITSFDPNTDSLDQLWEKITDGIIRAWSFEQEADHNLDRGPIFTIQGPSISQHVVNVSWLSRKQLFGGYVLTSEKGDSTYLQNTFVDAIVTDRIDVIEDLENHNKLDLIHLSMHKLRKVHKKMIHPLVTRQDRLKEKNSSIDLLKLINKDAATSIKKEEDIVPALTVLTRSLLKGRCMARCGNNASYSCCCRRNKQSSKTETTPSEDEQCESACSQTLRLAILLNLNEKFYLWQYCKHPLLIALLASVYLSSMADTADECYEENLQQSLMGHSNDFKRRAILLLEKMYTFNEVIAKQALDHVCDVWDIEESPIRFGHHYGIEEFISHFATQKDANGRMYAYYDEDFSNENGLKAVVKREITDPIARKDAELEISTSLRKPWVVRKHDIVTFAKHHWNLKSFGNMISAPIVRVTIHAICFLTTLVLFSIFLTTELQENSISIIEGLVFGVIVGELIEELWSTIRPENGCTCSCLRIILHLNNIWNILDYLFIILYIMAFLLHILAIPGVFVHIRRLYSVSLFLMFLRVFNFLLLFKKLGIIIIMVKEMLMDLLYYLVILFVLLFGAGVVYHANLYPYHNEQAFSTDIRSWRIWTVLRIPFWQVFGDPLLDTLEATDVGDCTNNETIWRNNPDVVRCPSYEWLTPVIAAMYMMLTNWLLLNIVIAMFSNRFQLILEKAAQKWGYHRHSVVIDYEHRYPSPFNIPIRLVFIMYHTLFRRACVRCCGNSQKQKVDPERMLNIQKEFAKEIVKEEGKKKGQSGKTEQYQNMS